MIRQLQNLRTKQLSVQNKTKFIPFSNERDNLGRIIKPKAHRKMQYNIMKIFQNLKKSTKEHCFEKEFQKMERKFGRVKRSLENRERNYDEEVNGCIQIVDELLEKQTSGNRNKQNLYVNLREKIDEKIRVARSALKHLPNRRSQVLSLSRKNSPQNKAINVTLFKSLSTKSEMMANFCSSGLKYEGLVEEKRFDPWKTWYKKEEYELFPGKKIQVKALQKSIYK